MELKRNKYMAMTLLALFVTNVWAATGQDAERLGNELTPSGAEKAGNKDGSIPAWTGAEQPTGGWKYGERRIDHYPHKDDKSLFTIDASNADKYADNLSAGQIATLKQVKGYKMEVYPSRRDCGIPDSVASNTKKNVGVAKIGADGWSLAEATVPGFPFPMPGNGSEAMWNAKMRYRGVATELYSNTTAVSPRKGSSEWIKAVSEQTYYYPWAVKGSASLSSLPPLEYQTYFAYKSPAALAGQALSIGVFLNQASTETFYYFPGQRRVRRMPSYAYDSPQIGFENQYTLDEPLVFNGTIDRFNWRLIGKKEMYIPYNAFGATDFKAKFEDVAQQDSINPSSRRYELHRVWVVEATVKPGTRHIAPKRTFFLDEDSWNIVMADDYDAQGKIFKAREGFLMPVYETGTCDVLAMVQYNLTEGRYVFDLHSVGAGKDIKYVTDASKSPRYKSQFYSSDNLRAISER